MAYENLKKLLLAHKMKKGDLAQKLMRDNAVVTNIFKGERSLTGEEAKMLASLFNVSTDVILDMAPYTPPPSGFASPAVPSWRGQTEVMGERKGAASKFRMVPVVSYVGAGAEVYPMDDYSKGDGMDMVEAPISKNLDPARAIALEVRGDSMAPLIHEGFLLFYDTRIYGVPGEWLEKICVVKVVDGPTYVKRIKKGTGVGLFVLCSLNPAEEDKLDVPVEWCALVKLMVQK